MDSSTWLSKTFNLGSPCGDRHIIPSAQVWDEAKRLRCEWYNDYEKTATKPPVVIADLEVIELNFRG